MNGYLLFDHVLQCKLIPADKMHPKAFDGAEKKFKPVPRNKIERLRHNKPKTEEAQAKNAKRVIANHDAKMKALKERGIDYDFPSFSVKSSA
ncbi:MKI67 FHA domain-interacting nucleolar phosphoprotein [Dinochytrium kinnereticum]|nr:MKI67 FHA domain-interacting nucleolar phosphoprotein [Dinochytrium kinnereticum]